MSLNKELLCFQYDFPCSKFVKLSSRSNHRMVRSITGFYSGFFKEIALNFQKLESYLILLVYMDSFFSM